MRVDANAAQTEPRNATAGQAARLRATLRAPANTGGTPVCPAGWRIHVLIVHSPVPACLCRSDGVDPRARRSSNRESRRPCLASIPRPDPSTPG